MIIDISATNTDMFCSPMFSSHSSCTLCIYFRPEIRGVTYEGNFFFLQLLCSTPPAAPILCHQCSQALLGGQRRSEVKGRDGRKGLEQWAGGRVGSMQRKMEGGSAGGGSGADGSGTQGS